MATLAAPPDQFTVCKEQTLALARDFRREADQMLTWEWLSNAEEDRAEHLRLGRTTVYRHLYEDEIMGTNASWAITLSAGELFEVHSAALRILS